MRIKFLTIALFLKIFISNSNAQFTLDLSQGMNFHLQETIEYEDGVEIDIMMPSQFAHNYVTNLVKMTGMPMTFQLVQTNSEFLHNAMAHIDRDKSYLIYNENFIKKIKDESFNDWSALFVLVHEIGHLLIRHPYSEDHKIKKEYELQADHFAGFWLNKLGATVEEAIQYSKEFTAQPRDYHPPKEQRIKAIIKGWNDAKGTGLMPTCVQTEGSLTFVNESTIRLAITIKSRINRDNQIRIILMPGASKTIKLNESGNEYRYYASQKMDVGVSLGTLFEGEVSVIPCKTQIEILK